jgi:hypothetical protein
MGKKTILAVLALAMSVTAAHAGGKTQWLHVAVDGHHEEERVRVNLPLSLLSAVLPLIEDEGFHDGRIVFDDAELDRADLVALLEAVRDAEDGEYVTIRDRGDHVRIAKDGKHVLVHVEERWGDAEEADETVEIRVPLAVVDALVSGEDDELNVLAAVEALGKHGDGNLVTVNDDGDLVRIWVDGQNQSD